MNSLTLIPALILSFFLNINQIQIQELFGKWQLVYFDGIERIRKSPQFLNADSATQANMQYRIQYRLESTVYQFSAVDSLKFTDFENQQLVLKKAKVKLDDQNILTIYEGNEVRQAKIVEFDANKLVLQPISQNPGAGKLVFERIIEKKEK